LGERNKLTKHFYNQVDLDIHSKGKH